MYFQFFFLTTIPLSNVKIADGTYSVGIAQARGGFATWVRQTQPLAAFLTPTLPLFCGFQLISSSSTAISHCVFSGYRVKSWIMP